MRLEVSRALTILSTAVIFSSFVGCSSSGPPATAAGTFPAAPYTTLRTDQGKLAIEARTAPDQPPIRGLGSVELRIEDPTSGGRVDGLSIDATTWMPAMGHGASVNPTVTSKGTGVYVVDNVDFFMPGTWELRLALHGMYDDTATIPLDVQ
jgi:hypothetical protein